MSDDRDGFEPVESVLSEVDVASLAGGREGRKASTDFRRIFMWERLVSGGMGELEAWDLCLRHPEIGKRGLRGREEPLVHDARLEQSLRRVLKRHAPEALAAVAATSQVALARSAAPAVQTVVEMADPERELTHKDYSSGEKNKLDAAKWLLGSLGVGPDGSGGGRGATVQVNVDARGNAEVVDAMSDPETRAAALALQRKIRRRGAEGAEVVEAEVVDADEPDDDDLDEIDGEDEVVPGGFRF